MTTPRALHLLFGLFALGVAGCELVRDERKRGTPTSEQEGTENVPAIRSTTLERWQPATAAAPPQEEDKKGMTKKEEPSLTPVETRTLEGTVRAIDAQRRLISVTVGGKSQTFP